MLIGPRYLLFLKNVPNKIAGSQPSEGSPSSQSPAGAAGNNDKAASNTVSSCAMATVVALGIGIFLPTFF